MKTKTDNQTASETPVKFSPPLKPAYSQIAQLLQAIENCERANNIEWKARHRETIESIIKNNMPSGSGFDSGTKLDFDASTPNKLVFYADYHHMNESGMYDGWTSHTITVKPDLAFGFDLKISGSNRNDFKAYAHDCFHSALTELV